MFKYDLLNISQHLSRDILLLLHFQVILEKNRMN